MCDEFHVEDSTYTAGGESEDVFISVDKNDLECVQNFEAGCKGQLKWLKLSVWLEL